MHNAIVQDVTPWPMGHGASLQQPTRKVGAMRRSGANRQEADFVADVAVEKNLDDGRCLVEVTLCIGLQRRIGCVRCKKVLLRRASTASLDLVARVPVSSGNKRTPNQDCLKRKAQE